MCNVNIFIKSKTFLNDDNDSDDFISFYNTATTNSFINNSDGDGVYLSGTGTLIKSIRHINLTKLSNEINDSNFILSHQRYATSGHNERYIHPFKRDGFVLIHNGVIREYADDKNSDTFNLFNLFIENFNRDKKDGRNKRVIRAIKSVLDNIKTGGYYSIGLYDEQQKALYYFKNSGAVINAVMSKNRDGVYLTTATANLDVLNVFKDDFKDLEISDNVIYKIGITKNNKIKIREMGKIREKKTPIKSIPIYTPDYKTNWDDYDYSGMDNDAKKPFKKRKKIKVKKSDLSDFKINLGVSNDNKRACGDCGADTTNTAGQIGDILCDDCLLIEYNAYNSYRYK